MKSTLKIKGYPPIKVPMIPNFIKIGTNMVSVKELPEEVLAEIGIWWIQNLISKGSKLGKPFRYLALLVTGLERSRNDS